MSDIDPYQGWQIPSLPAAEPPTIVDIYGRAVVEGLVHRYWTRKGVSPSLFLNFEPGDTTPRSTIMQANIDGETIESVFKAEKQSAKILDRGGTEAGTIVLDERGFFCKGVLRHRSFADAHWSERPKSGKDFRETDGRLIMSLIPEWRDSKLEQDVQFFVQLPSAEPFTQRHALLTVVVISTWKWPIRDY